MDLNALTAEQRAKAKACTTAEELKALVAEEGLELTDDQLDAVAGGGDEWYEMCTTKECNADFDM